jgi:AcrR family transcriptional regulator
MPRPSKNLDQAMLQSGRALFAQSGCAGLSVRAVAEHAGANPGMFHYHFKTKENFLRSLLQQVYEEMFSGLSGAASQEGPALDRLRAALIAVGRLPREHRRVFARVWMDAVSGEPVAAEFMQRNVPRHLALLLDLMERAQREGDLREVPPLQRFALLMGSVAMPVVFAAGLVEVAIGDVAFRRRFDQDVMSDAAIAQRADMVLAALAAPAPRHGRGRELR